MNVTKIWQLLGKVSVKIKKLIW